LDLDGVLADTIQAFCAILNVRYSRSFTPEQFNRWDAWDVAGISKREFLGTLDEAWFNWREIPPIEENLAEKVSSLNSIGIIDIVTGRSKATVPFAKEWLRAQKITYDAFVRTVSMAAKSYLNYDVFIDDSADLMALISSRLFGSGILYEQPWNRTAAYMPRIFKVRRWDEIFPLLEDEVQR
jgi:5'(3')-deoxyribonucleotidase